MSLQPTDAAGNAIERVQAKHPFYKSKIDGTIYPAMTSPPGYEDKNPDDWEPASEAEIAAERQKLADIRALQRAERQAARASEDDTLPPPVATLDVSTGAVDPPPAVVSETQPEAPSESAGSIDGNAGDTFAPPAFGDAPSSGFTLPGSLD